MRNIYFLFLLFSAAISAQKIQVVDSETGKPISNARIILSNQLLYTNEDGFAPVDQDSKDFEVSASGFKKEIIPAFKELVKLKPQFKDIEEVKIIDVDIEKIFRDLQRNYHKRYYSEPSLYDITLKSKNFNNGKLFFMVIAEAKLWSKSNMYNYRDGFKKNYDDILQMQLNNVKYFKKDKSGAIFNTKTNEFSHAEMGEYFFSFEINRIVNNMEIKDSKFTGRLLSEDGDQQLIGIKITSGQGIIIEGEMKYDKKDKAILYYDVFYQQSAFPPYKRTNTDGKEYEYQLGDVQLTYDFYKKDGRYIQTLKKTSGDKFFFIYDGKKDERKSTSEMVYNTFSKSDKKGLDSKVDFTKNIWDNVAVKDNKENTILLSKEELEFINQE